MRKLAASAATGGLTPILFKIVPLLLAVVIAASGAVASFGLLLVLGGGTITSEEEGDCTPGPEETPVNPVANARPAEPAAGEVSVGRLSADIPQFYRDLFAKAAASKNVDAGLLATVFWKENGEHYPEPPPPYGTGRRWPVSHAGAGGPFQFMPTTWAGYGVDGNGDGRKDRNDLTDAAYGSANFLAALGGKAGTPLGSVEKPNEKPTLVNVMASYNAGPAGNFRNRETQDYIREGVRYYQGLQSGIQSVPVSAPAQVEAPASTCVTVAAAAASQGQCPNATPQVYVLGSGLASALTNAELARQLSEQGYNTTVNAQSDLSLENFGEVLERHRADVARASAIIVSVGDTGQPADPAFEDKLRSAIMRLQSVSPTASLIWINYAGPDAGPRNAALARLAPLMNVEVLNWFNIAYPGVDQYGPQPEQNPWFAGDPAGVLPNSDGTAALAREVVIKTTGEIGSVANYVCTVPVGLATGGGVTPPPNLGPPNMFGYYRMPPPLNGAYDMYSCDGRQFGSHALVSTLYTVSNQWKQMYPEGWVNIGDLNAIGHKSHKWGVAVDLDATTNGRDFAADYTKGNYNRAATIQLGILFVDTGQIKNIWYNDAEVNAAVKAHAASRGIPLTMKPIPGHDNHFHVDVNAPRGPLWMPGC